MKRLWMAIPAVLLFACTKQEAAPAAPSVKEVDVEQVASWLKTKDAVVLDANGDDFRQTNGVVPGAVLLRNYLDWEPSEVLGADKNKQVVFYCTSRT